MSFEHNLTDFLNSDSIKEKTKFNKNNVKKPLYTNNIPKKYIIHKDGKITEIKENKDEFFGRVKESDETIKPIN